MVLLHGLGGDSGQLWPLFADCPFPRLAPDARAHGRTELIGEEEAFTFTGLASDTLALLDALGIQRVAVAGVSMGAGTAVALARRIPERVAGLLLIRPAWLARPYPSNLAAYVTAGQLLRDFDVPGARRRFAESAEYRAVAQVSAAGAVSLQGQFDDTDARRRSVRLRCIPGSTPFADLTELAELAALAVPVVFVGARSDPTHPVETARAWAGAIAGSHYVELPSRDESPTSYDAALREAATTFSAQCVEGEGGHD